MGAPSGPVGRDVGANVAGDSGDEVSCGDRVSVVSDGLRGAETAGDLPPQTVTSAWLRGRCRTRRSKISIFASPKLGKRSASFALHR